MTDDALASQHSPAFQLDPHPIDVTFSAPYSATTELLSSPLMDHHHQHLDPEHDEVFTVNPSLLQHYATQPVALTQSGQTLITVPEPHEHLPTYENPSQLPPEPIVHPLDQSGGGTLQSSEPTILSSPPAPPPRTLSFDMQLQVTSIDLLMDKQKQKGRSKTTTKKIRQDLRVGPRTKYLPCIGCDAVFDRPSALKLHMLSHTGEKPHECPRCHRRFSVPSNMRRHRSTCGIARSRRSFVNITMPPVDTRSSDMEKETCDGTGRVNPSGKYIPSPTNDHPDDGGESGCSRGRSGAPSHEKIQTSPRANTNSSGEGPLAANQQQFTVRWVEPLEYPSVPAPHGKQPHHQRSSHSRRFSTFVMTSPASTAQPSSSDLPERKFQIYRPQPVDDPVPTTTATTTTTGPSPASGFIPAASSDQPTTATAAPSLAEADPVILPPISNPATQKRAENHKRREDGELDAASHHSLTSGTTLSSVSSASSLYPLRQDSSNTLPSTSRGSDVSTKAATLDQIVCEEHHLADNPVQHSTALVQISGRAGSASAMDQGGEHVDSEPICPDGPGTHVYHHIEGGLVELSHNVLTAFYPSLQHMRLPAQVDEYSFLPVFDEQTTTQQRHRQRRRSHDLNSSPQEASESMSTSPTPSSSVQAYKSAAQCEEDEQIPSNNISQGLVGPCSAGTSRDESLGRSHGEIRISAQQGSNSPNSWLPLSLSHCRNACQLTSSGPFLWWDQQSRASPYPLTHAHFLSSTQLLHQGPESASSKELRFVYHHYDKKGGRREVHDTSSLGVPFSSNVLPANPAVSHLGARRIPRGITLPLAPVRPRGSDNRGRASKMSSRRNTLWLSAPTPDSGFLPMNVDTNSFELAHDTDVSPGVPRLPPPLLPDHPIPRSSHSEELISSPMHDPSTHDARFSGYHSLMHISHPQSIPHYSPPTPSTSHSSQIFSLPADTSEDDDSEGSEWEERDSYSADVPRQPYHAKNWCERLPGPAPLAEGVLERDAARARRWLLTG